MPLSIDQIFSRKRPNTAEPCYGDSGGAVLIQRNGVTFLAGVISMIGVSSAGDGCVDFAVSTRVDVNQEFIRRFQNGGRIS